ncbi:MAG: glycosyltransferase [Actinomycetota bacterium]
MTQTVLFNALAARPGGGAMVWEALAAGGRGHGSDLKLIALTSHGQVCSMIKEANPAIEVRELAAGSGIRSFTQEQALIDEALGPDPNRVVVSQNRMTRGSAGPQVVLHINLSRYQPGSGARGWKQRPAELIRDRAAKAALTGAAANIFESNFLLDAAIGRYPNLSINNPSVAHVGLADGWALPVDAPVADHDKRRGRLLAITSPQPHKDNDTLVRVLADLNRAEPGSWTLAICSGREAAAFQPQLDLAESLGVRDSIELLGFLDRPGLAAELDRTVAVVSASKVESFCSVALESMARGVPAVVTNLASMPESVGPDGLLVGEGDVDGFVRTVQTLDRDPAAWADRSAEARRWAATMTWDRFGLKVMNIVEDAAGTVGR